MKYLHTMIRVRDIEASLRFYCEGLGLKETRRMENAAGKFTLVFLVADETPGAEIELTYNWGSDEDYGTARNFGHLAFRVEDIYKTCAHLQAMGYTIDRPPRDGHMAFVRSPDLVSIELMQDGNLPPQEPWASMQNTGAVMGRPLTVSSQYLRNRASAVFRYGRIQKLRTTPKKTLGTTSVPASIKGLSVMSSG